MGELRIGTCSWKYPSWAGLVYSSTEPDDYLAEYAQKYDSVEVDQWFWSLGAPGSAGAALPRPETAAGYAASTPAGFRFTVKCPNALSMPHYRATAGARAVPNPHFLEPALLYRFLDALDPLLPKLGLLILQFEYLNLTKMPSRETFMGRLSPFLEALPGDLPFAVEIRNPRWMDAAWFDFLAAHRVAPVILQGYWMDDAAAVLSTLGGRMGPRLCLRLHGEDREGMEERTGGDWSRIERPKDAELPRIMLSLLELLDRGASAYLNVNNHYEGSAPLTIEKIRAILEARTAG